MAEGKDVIKLIETIVNLEYSVLKAYEYIDLIASKTNIKLTKEEEKRLDEKCIRILQEKYPHSNIHTKEGGVSNASN